MNRVYVKHPHCGSYTMAVRAERAQAEADAASCSACAAIAGKTHVLTIDGQAPLVGTKDEVRTALAAQIQTWGYAVKAVVTRVDGKRMAAADRMFFASRA